MDTSTKSHVCMEVLLLGLVAPDMEEVFLSLVRHCHQPQQVLQEVVLMDSLDDFQTCLNQKLVSDQLLLKSLLKTWLSTNPEQLEVLMVCLQESK